MAGSVNKVIIIGNVGKDPETRYAPSGSAICNVSVATSRRWKDKSAGEKREETEWHRVVFFDRLAEIAQEYLSSGKPVYVEGRLKTRKWADKDGVDRYSTEIIATEMQLLGSRDDAPKQERQAQPSTKQQPRQAAPDYAARRGGSTAPTKVSAEDPFGPMDDDIPY